MSWTALWWIILIGVSGRVGWQWGWKLIELIERWEMGKEVQLKGGSRTSCKALERTFEFRWEEEEGIWVDR